MAEGASGTVGAVRESVGQLRGGGRGWTLLLVATGWLFISGFRVVLPALLPAIKADFAIGNAEAGFALSVLWGIYAVLQFPTGIAADRTGERPWLIGGALLAAASFLAFYLAPGYALLLVASALFGFASGLFGTPRDMLLTRSFPHADSTAYGVTFAAGSLGAAVLPAVATAIALRGDWRLAVIWLLPLLGVVGLGIWRVVPPREGTADRRLAARETVRRTVGALTEPAVLGAAGVMLLFVFTYQGLVSFLPTYLIEVKGLSAAVTATLFGSLFVVGAAVQPTAGHLADHHGAKRTAVGLIAAASALLVALTVLRGPALWVVVPLLGGLIAVGPLTSAFIVRSLSDPVKGTGWGLLRSGFFGVGASSSTVVGVFADAGHFDAGFLLLAGLVAVAGGLWWWLPLGSSE